MTSSVTVVIATRDRPEMMREALASVLEQDYAGPVEVILVFDQAEPELDLATEADPLRRVVVTTNGRSPGLAGARNTGITASQSDYVAFLDDDVEAEPGWLAGVWDYFTRHDCVAAQGSVLWPPEAMADKELYALLDRYRTIVHLDLAPDTVRTKLTGANMAVRRHAFNVVGVFNEKLGPGAAGLSEDNELADRIRRAGGWIGYMKDARVVHEIDRSRLTEKYGKELEEMKAEYAKMGLARREKTDA